METFLWLPQREMLAEKASNPSDCVTDKIPHPKISFLQARNPVKLKFLATSREPGHTAFTNIITKGPEPS